MKLIQILLVVAFFAVAARADCKEWIAEVTKTNGEIQMVGLHKRFVLRLQASAGEVDLVFKKVEK